MSTPRALTLADQCDHEDAFEVACARELRRLHAENEDYGATIDYLTCENAEHIGEIVALKERRDELLEALEKIIEMNRVTARDQFGDSEQAERWACVIVARAAIAKATWEKS